MLAKDELLHLLDLSQDEASLRKMLCDWIGCTANVPASVPAATPLAVIAGSVAGDAFHMSIALGPNPTPVDMVLDTGAFEMLLTKEIADQLSLPNDGPLDISGVTGSSPAYTSHVAVTLNGHDFTIHCVVDPEYTGTPLFGLRFFVDHSLTLSLDTVTQTLTITQ